MSNQEFWAVGNTGLGARNAYKHYLKHVVRSESTAPVKEFPDIQDAITYIKQARDFLDNSGPNTVTYTAGSQRFIFDKNTYLFATETLPTNPGGKVIKTFFRSNLKDNMGNIITPYQWIYNRGYRGPVF